MIEYSSLYAIRNGPCEEIALVPGMSCKTAVITLLKFGVVDENRGPLMQG